MGSRHLEIEKKKNKTKKSRPFVFISVCCDCGRHIAKTNNIISNNKMITVRRRQRLLHRLRDQPPYKELAGNIDPPSTPSCVYCCV